MSDCLILHYNSSVALQEICNKHVNSCDRFVLDVLAVQAYILLVLQSVTKLYLMTHSTMLIKTLIS